MFAERGSDGHAAGQRERAGSSVHVHAHRRHAVAGADPGRSGSEQSHRGEGRRSSQGAPPAEPAAQRLVPGQEQSGAQPVATRHHYQGLGGPEDGT